MKNDKRGILVYLIGILALIVSVGSLALIVLELMQTLKEGGSIIDVLMSGTYDTIIEIVFAVMELSMGVAFIKQWKKGEHFEIQKSLSQLIMAVAYATFMQIFVAEFVKFFLSGFSDELSIGIIYIGAYVIFTILITSIGTLVKKRQLMNILAIMLIASIFAIGFSVYDTISVLNEENAIYDILLVLANAIIVVLTFVFEISSISFYKKNPLALEFDMLGNEDYDIIEKTDKYEVLKIYGNRVKEGSAHVFNTIIYLLGIVAFACGIVFYAIENDFTQYFTGDLGDFIENVINMASSLSFASMMKMVMVISVVVFQPIMLLSLSYGVLKRQGEGKLCVYSAVALGLAIALFTSLALIIDIVMDITFGGFEDIDFSNYSLWEVALIGLYIINTLISKTAGKAFQNVQNGINAGDSYCSHLKSMLKISIPTGIFSILALAIVFLQGYFEQGVILISYPIMMGATLFLMIALLMENKNPYCEYTIVKRKIVSHSVQAENQEI